MFVIVDRLLKDVNNKAIISSKIVSNSLIFRSNEDSVDIF